MSDTPPGFKASQSGLRLLWIAALIVIADQLTKLWVVNNLPLQHSINLLPVLDLYHTLNRGAAWSFLADAGGWQRWFFSALAIGVSIALPFWLRRIALATHAMLATGIVLILGGAVGNVIDRLRLGHVIDFVSVYWNDARFPAFNVADAAISIGAALVLLDALRETRRERAAARAARGS